MTKLALAALTLLLAAGPQDAAKIGVLVKQLEAEDWVDQAKAAKELVLVGKPALEALGKAAIHDSPAVRYWSDTASREIFRRTGGGGPTTPPTAPTAVPLSVPAPNAGFAPGEDDIGSVMFICNNAKHGDYECVLSGCRVCGKMKKFAYDYTSKSFRCTICKREYAPIKCDRCGDLPGPRTRIRMKRH